MKHNFFHYCIYTMKSRQSLDFIFNTGIIETFKEGKSWASGKKLFEEAVKKNQDIPIIFSAAEEASGLIYGGFLKSIEITRVGKNKAYTEYSFTRLRKIENPKPLSVLSLKTTGKPLSDNYIRPYAVCLTPVDLSGWFDKTGLPPIPKTRKTSREEFLLGNEKLDFNLMDFWQWYGSDLVGNTQRGILAEYIVAKALGLKCGVRAGWDAYDLLIPDKEIKVEVKSSAYIQSWYQKKYSKVSFGIGKTKAWDEFTNKQAKESKRQADIYVFCLLKHKIQETLNPMELNQWEFYVLPTNILNEKMGDTKNISLKKLLTLKPKKCGFDGLLDAIILLKN